MSECGGGGDGGTDGTDGTDNNKLIFLMVPIFLMFPKGHKLKK